jgi:hypothetical protein
VISKRHFVNKLRELGYSFKEQKKRAELWRKPGTTSMVWLPRNKELSEVYVVSTLLQCGLSPTEIEEFIRDAKA